MLDEQLNLKELTNYFKQSASDPTMKERDRFELGEAEALATPIEVVENSVPVSVDEHGSSLHHYQPRAIEQDLEELEEDVGDSLEPLFDEGQKQPEKIDKPFGDEVFGEDKESDAEDTGVDESFFFDELVAGEDESGPGTKREHLRFGKKKGKLSTAVSKLGRRK